MLHEIDDLDLADDVPRLSLRRPGSYPLNSWLPSWLEAGVDASLSRKCARMLWSWTSLMLSPMREISKTTGIRAGGDQEVGGTGRCPGPLRESLQGSIGTVVWDSQATKAARRTHPRLGAAMVSGLLHPAARDGWAPAETRPKPRRSSRELGSWLSMSRRQARTHPPAPTGTFNQKIQCRLSPWVSAPPTSGPSRAAPSPAVKSFPLALRGGGRDRQGARRPPPHPNLTPRLSPVGRAQPRG
jgi:hypothetical protein